MNALTKPQRPRNHYPKDPWNWIFYTKTRPKCNYILSVPSILLTSCAKAIPKHSKSRVYSTIHLQLKWTKTVGKYITHSIHGMVYLPTWMVDFFMVNVDKATSPMDAMGTIHRFPQIPPGVLQSLDDVFQVSLLGIALHRLFLRRTRKHKWTKLRRNHKTCYQIINQRWDFKQRVNLASIKNMVFLKTKQVSHEKKQTLWHSLYWLLNTDPYKGLFMTG